MLNFTEHIKRILLLANQSLVHVQGEKLDTAREDLFKIIKNAVFAMQQVDELIEANPEREK